MKKKKRCKIYFEKYLKMLIKDNYLEILLIKIQKMLKNCQLSKLYFQSIS